MVNQQFAFAVHIMTCLAFTPEEVLGSRTLAASVNTNPVVVRRILLSLRNAGLIKTFPGKAGGARLRKSPNRITLLDIYDAMETRPTIALNERRALRRCPVSCNMKRIMGRVVEISDRAVRKHLETITLKDIVRKIR